VIQPTALNVLIIGLSGVIFGFFWRMLATRLSETAIGQAMAVIY